MTERINCINLTSWAIWNDHLEFSAPKTTKTTQETDKYSMKYKNEREKHTHKHCIMYRSEMTN